MRPECPREPVQGDMETPITVVFVNPKAHNTYFIGLNIAQGVHSPITSSLPFDGKCSVSICHVYHKSVVSFVVMLHAVNVGIWLLTLLKMF